MQLLLTFLEGVISFISPCMLPMLPIYVSYFAAQEGRKSSTVLRAAAFVLGFTVVFCALGVFAGALGELLWKYKTALNIVCGAIVILFGLSYLDVIPLRFLRGVQKHKSINGVFSAFVFGVIYSVNLTPCVGAFLGSALMLASASASKWQGLWLLLVYSLGLGVPFLISAILIDNLKGLFSKIKKHYKIINLVCGIFLIFVGVAMMLGLLDKLVGIL